MKNVETKIKGIEIVIAGKSITVTPEQANELYCALANLLGKPTITVTPTWYPYTWQHNGTVTSGYLDATSPEPNTGTPLQKGKITIN
jgi:hypothetical protein